MLIIDLRRLDDAPVEVEGEIASDDPQWANTGLELVSPLVARATAEGSTTRGVWVRGSLKGHVRAACRRCLEPLELEVGDEFAILFDPKTSEAEGDLTLYGLDPKAEELDLRTPLRERMLLAVPEYPLCRDGCRGLCARCGANLNEGDCSCEPAGTDPRWGPLQALRNETRR
ncbi:MAG: DUF177 domain-containing protein [Gemmatimonadota bacterium]|nr:MAG: DUF177 domain-containing protein [Gemmatimonadota bacterium]